MVSVWERADGELGAEGATGLVYLMESWGGGEIHSIPLFIINYNL